MISESLLTTNPSAVVATDISLPQLHLVALKRAAFETLSYADMLSFLGINDNTDRLMLYRKVSCHLLPQEKIFWDNQTQLINTGIIYCGKFEQYFSKFRKYLLPFTHSKNEIEHLLSEKTAGQQRQYFHEKWNNRRWKILMNIFFSKYVLGRYGRDPEFLKHVNISVPSYIRSRANEHLSSICCQTNYMLRMILTGRYSSVSLPHYLRRENFEKIRNNIGKLQLLHADANTAIRQSSYDVYCFSNIFEYISAEDFALLSQDWYACIPNTAKLAFWNLMAPRSFSEVAPDKYIYEAKSKVFHQIDKGFFYSRFLIEERI
jgi:S-adenosylmethionine-diacylglycerol 3-amino-3-carboxypropyl transferase